MAECQLPKLDVAGSNPVGRSKLSKGLRGHPQPFGVFTAHVTNRTRIHSPAREKSSRALALKLVKGLGGKAKIRRAELVQHLQAQGYSEGEVDAMLKRLHSAGVLKCTVGKYSEAYVA